MKRSTIYGEVIRDPGFKQGKKVNHEDLVAAINRVYDKRYPIIPNAKTGGVDPTVSMRINTENKTQRVFNPPKKQK